MVDMGQQIWIHTIEGWWLGQLSWRIPFVTSGWGGHIYQGQHIAGFPLILSISQCWISTLVWNGYWEGWWPAWCYIRRCFFLRDWHYNDGILLRNHQFKQAPDPSRSKKANPKIPQIFVAPKPSQQNWDPIQSLQAVPPVFVVQECKDMSLPQKWINNQTQSSNFQLCFFFCITTHLDRYLQQMWGGFLEWHQRHTDPAAFMNVFQQSGGLVAWRPFFLLMQTIWGDMLSLEFQPNGQFLS